MIINIVSASGGQGRSLLASLLASALSGLYPGKVLLVDGCCDEGAQRRLGAERTTAYDLGDALCGRCCVSDAMYSMDGLRIMPAPADDRDVRPEELAGLLGALARNTEFVIFDSPCGSWSLMQTVAETADITLICSSADQFHRDAPSRLRRGLPEADESCRLVLTDYSVKGAKEGRLWGIDRAIDRVGARLIGVIPESATRRSDTSAAGKNIAARLLGRDVPLMKLS